MPIEVTSAVIGALGAILGALISFILLSKLQKKREKVSQAVKLIEQYGSPEMIVIRNKAGACLKNALKNESSITWNSLHKSLGDNWIYVSQIEHFYKRVRLLVEHEEVCSKITKGYFSKEFNHWYNKYFKQIEAGSFSSGETDEKKYQNLYYFFDKT